MLFYVYWCYAHECLLPVMHLLWYVVYMISCSNLKSERKREWVSIVSLSEQEFLQGVQSKCSQGVRWQRVQIGSICSHLYRSAVGHRSHARSVQERKSLRVVNLSKVWETVATGVCRVEGIQHLEVSESGRKECAEESSLRLRVMRKLRRDKSFESIEGSIRSWCISSDSRHWRFVS